MLYLPLCNSHHNDLQLYIEIFLITLFIKVTDAPLVPPLVLFLAKHPLVDKFDLSNVVRVNSGAAPLGKELETAMLKRLPQVERIRQGEEHHKCFDNLVKVKSICFNF